MHLTRALRDCKQRSLTVSRKAPTVSRKLPPNIITRAANILEIWADSVFLWSGFPAGILDFSGPLNRLNAILSLLHPLDRCRTPSAIVSTIGRALSRPISHPRTGGTSQPPHSKPLRGLNRAIVVLWGLYQTTLRPSHTKHQTLQRPNNRSIFGF